MWPTAVLIFSNASLGRLTVDDHSCCVIHFSMGCVQCIQSERRFVCVCRLRHTGLVPLATNKQNEWHLFIYLSVNYAMYLIHLASYHTFHTGWFQAARKLRKQIGRSNGTYAKQYYLYGSWLGQTLSWHLSPLTLLLWNLERAVTKCSIKCVSSQYVHGPPHSFAMSAYSQIGVPVFLAHLCRGIFICALIFTIFWYMYWTQTSPFIGHCSAYGTYFDLATSKITWAGSYLQYKGLWFYLQIYRHHRNGMLFPQGHGKTKVP